LYREKIVHGINGPIILPRSSLSHSTKDENQFLDGLGGWSARENTTRQKLLASYYRAALNRKDWGNINSSIILGRCKSELGL
jgi:hypothetical protein